MIFSSTFWRKRNTRLSVWGGKAYYYFYVKMKMISIFQKIHFSKYCPKGLFRQSELLPSKSPFPLLSMRPNVLLYNTYIYLHNTHPPPYVWATTRTCYLGPDSLFPTRQCFPFLVGSKKSPIFKH